LCVVPDAILDDDIFNVFLSGDVSVIDFIRHSETMKKGKHVVLEGVQYKTTKGLSLTAEEPCMIEGDGEILGHLPASIELSEARVSFLM
jgi:diacylglycerol kinase (ATP)